MKTYSEVIKEIRLKKGMSLREFAELCALSHAYIDKLEKGIDPRNGKPVSPTLDTFKQICQYTDYPLEKFLSETGYISDASNTSSSDTNKDSLKKHAGTLSEYMTIGERLRNRLTELGMKQTELAKKLNISASTLNGYFTDYREPDVETLSRLAEALETSVESIITDDPTPPGKEKAPSVIAERGAKLMKMIEDMGGDPVTEEDLPLLAEIAARNLPLFKKKFGKE